MSHFPSSGTKRAIKLYNPVQILSLDDFESSFVRRDNVGPTYQLPQHLFCFFFSLLFLSFLHFSQRHHYSPFASDLKCSPSIGAAGSAASPPPRTPSPPSPASCGGTRTASGTPRPHCPTQVDHHMARSHAVARAVGPRNRHLQAQHLQLPCRPRSVAAVASASLAACSDHVKQQVQPPLLLATLSWQVLLAVLHLLMPQLDARAAECMAVRAADSVAARAALGTTPGHRLCRRPRLLLRSTPIRRGHLVLLIGQTRMELPGRQRRVTVPGAAAPIVTRRGGATRRRGREEKKKKKKNDVVPDGWALYCYVGRNHF